MITQSYQNKFTQITKNTEKFANFAQNSIMSERGALASP